METIKVVNNLIQISKPTTISLEQLDRNIATLERFITQKQGELEALKSQREQAVAQGVKTMEEVKAEQLTIDKIIK